MHSHGGPGRRRNHRPAAHTGSTSAGRGVPNTGLCSWPGREPCGGDRLGAHLADSVAALLQSSSGGLDAGEVRLRPLDERRQLCSFVSDGLTLGVVLVVGVGVRRCREDGFEVPRHGCKSGSDLTSFLAQALGGGLKVEVLPSGRRGIGRRWVRRSGHLYRILQEAVRRHLYPRVEPRRAAIGCWLDDHATPANSFPEGHAWLSRHPGMPARCSGSERTLEAHLHAAK